MSIKRKKIDKCKENWKTIPYSSEHLWHADFHQQPSGDCIKCGYPVSKWDEKLHKKLKLSLTWKKYVEPLKPMKLKNVAIKGDWEREFDDKFYLFSSEYSISFHRDNFTGSDDNAQNFGNKIKDFIKSLLQSQLSIQREDLVREIEKIARNCSFGFNDKKLGGKIGIDYELFTKDLKSVNGGTCYKCGKENINIVGNFIHKC